MMKHIPTLVLRRSERINHRRGCQYSKPFPLVRLPYVVLSQMCSIITGLEVFTVLKIFSPKVLFDEHILWQILRNGVRRISLTVNLPCNNSNRYLITESEIQLIGSDRAYRRYILQGFTLSSFERICCTMSTDAFRTYCRLLSYNIYSSLRTFPLLSFFDHLYLIVRRQLNSYEMKIFSRCRTNENLNKPSDFVKTYQEFLNNMDARFKYLWWRSAVNFTDFIIAGNFLFL
ncbi:unnamed protein product [Rotaria sp. Silwood1]|nr:unnamed protein product [Rotaria sp. Silwood1]CAF3792187.1 unnamed protein product [Rotaria sp. Silwood1]